MKKVIAITSYLFLTLFLAGCSSQTTAPAPEQTSTSSAMPAVTGQPVDEMVVSEGETAPKTINVSIKNFAFNPPTITINPGDTVTWTNEDSVAHTATGDDFDTGHLEKGQSGSYTFQSAGTFDYICTIHPSMKGQVIVGE